MKRRRLIAGLGAVVTDSNVKKAANAGCGALVAAGGGPGVVCAAIVNIDAFAGVAQSVLDMLGISAKGEYDYLTVPEALAKANEQVLARTRKELSESYIAARKAAGLPPDRFNTPTPSGTAAAAASFIGAAVAPIGDPRSELYLTQEIDAAFPSTPYRQTSKGRVTALDKSKGWYAFSWSGWPQPPDKSDVDLYAHEWQQLFYHARQLPLQTATENAIRRLDQQIEAEKTALKAAQRLQDQQAKQASAEKMAQAQAKAKQAASAKAAQSKNDSQKIVLALLATGVALGVGAAFALKRKH